MNLKIYNEQVDSVTGGISALNYIFYKKDEQNRGGIHAGLLDKIPTTLGDPKFLNSNASDLEKQNYVRQNLSSRRLRNIEEKIDQEMARQKTSP